MKSRTHSSNFSIYLNSSLSTINLQFQSCFSSKVHIQIYHSYNKSIIFHIFLIFVGHFVLVNWLFFPKPFNDPGAGCGLVAALCAALGAEVTASDAYAAVRRRLRRTAALNAQGFAVQEIPEWGGGWVDGLVAGCGWDFGKVWMMNDDVGCSFGI